MTRWSESHLVRRILAGDPQACTELVDAHHEAIYRFLHHLCRDAHQAEDLAQETFVTAWTRIGTFNGSAGLATWLHRIAYCKFVDSHRCRQRRVPLQQGEPLDQVRADAAGPLDVAVADEQEQQLHAAIAQLGDADREVLVLHYFQGFSFRDMAEVLSIQVGLAKWRTSQAVAKLKRRMGET